MEFSFNHFIIFEHNYRCQSCSQGCKYVKFKGAVFDCCCFGLVFCLVGWGFFVCLGVFVQSKIGVMWMRNEMAK